MEGRQTTSSACMVTISNAPILGSKVLCVPDAKMDDGLLDVAVLVGDGIALSAPMLSAPSAPPFAPDPPLVSRATVAAGEAAPPQVNHHDVGEDSAPHDAGPGPWMGQGEGGHTETSVAEHGQAAAPRDSSATGWGDARV